MKSIELNLRRGVTIKNLAFSSHNMEPCIGTLPHGYFLCIYLSADYYSGGGGDRVTLTKEMDDTANNPA